MIPRSRKALHLVGDFLRTPSVGRAVAGLLAGAIGAGYLLDRKGQRHLHGGVHFSVLCFQF